MKNLHFLLILAPAAIWMSSCSDGSAKETPKAKEQVCITDSLAKIIIIDTATIDHIDDELKLSGEISFNDNKVVKLFPFSSGRVLDVKVSLGDKVSQGQTLATIRSADVAGNYSDLSTAGNDLAIAKRAMDNEESLFKSGIASEREYMEAKENYNKAVAAENKLKSQIAINGGGHTTENGTYTITSPINGYVVERKINQGGFIRSDNTDNMFTIGDIKDVWVWANVYETDISRVKEGYKANITTLAYPDKVFTGVVDKVNEVLDPVTKVMKIRIRLPNVNNMLKPEMFANIVIMNEEGKKAISVPETALIDDNGKSFVVVYHDKCKMEIKQVEVLKITAGKAYISSGIEAGDRVISQNQVLLYKALIS
ncbi:MAG TPA: efflux RND transporter periplasmic adaptor subunit [Chitinophagaceae bacterium]|jgi:cobalt-zinc-cadmium efflux system membrane fusion protein